MVFGFEVWRGSSSSSPNWNSLLCLTHWFRSNSGQSESQAWKSLSKVSSTAFQPGDTIKFKAGSTWSGSLKATSSGTPDKYVTYTTYGGSQRAKIIVSGTGFANNGHAYVRIENFEMAGGSYGINYYHNAHHGYIYNCYCHHQENGFGIRFGKWESPPYGSAQGSTVDRCIVENSLWGIGVRSYTDTEAWTDFTIKNCQITDITKCGIKVMETVAYILGNTIKRCGDSHLHHCIYYGNPSRSD